MASQSFNLETRISALNAPLTEQAHQQAVDAALRAANGDMPTAMASLKEQLPEASLQKIALAHSLADLLDDNVPVVKALAEQPDVTNLRDLALRFNVEKLVPVVDPQAVPETSPVPRQRRKRGILLFPCNTSYLRLNPQPCCNGWCKRTKSPLLIRLYALEW